MTPPIGESIQPSLLNMSHCATSNKEYSEWMILFSVGTMGRSRRHVSTIRNPGIEADPNWGNV